MYLRNGEIISSHHERNNDGGEINAKLSVFVNNARPCGGYKMVQWSELEMESAYWYILDNCDEVEPFKKCVSRSMFNVLVLIFGFNLLTKNFKLNVILQ